MNANQWVSYLLDEAVVDIDSTVDELTAAAQKIWQQWRTEVNLDALSRKFWPEAQNTAKYAQHVLSRLKRSTFNLLIRYSILS